MKIGVLLKNPLFKNILLAITVAFLGFILLILAFLLDALFLPVLEQAEFVLVRGLHLEVGHDAPGIGLAVDNGLERLVDLLPVREQFIPPMPSHRTGHISQTVQSNNCVFNSLTRLKSLCPRYFGRLVGVTPASCG